MVYAVYKDDGASGACGQSVSITAPRTHLCIFDNIEDFNHANLEKIPRISSRRNPRFTVVFSDNENDCVYTVVDNRKTK